MCEPLLAEKQQTAVVVIEDTFTCAYYTRNEYHLVQGIKEGWPCVCSRNPKQDQRIWPRRTLERLSASAAGAIAQRVTFVRRRQTTVRQKYCTTRTTRIEKTDFRPKVQRSARHTPTPSHGQSLEYASHSTPHTHFYNIPRDLA